MGEWSQTTLGQYLESTGGSIKTGPFGTALKAAEYSETGVPLISVGEVGEGVLKVGPRTPKISAETALRLPEYLLRTGDVVFGRKGAVERSALITEAQDGYFLGSDGIRVRFGDSSVPQFMGVQFRMSSIRQWLLKHAAGTTMPSLNQSVLRDLPIVIPPKRTQRSIAEILGALDDKIAANERVVSISELLAAEVWRNSGKGGEFPLSSLAKFVNGRAYTKGASGTGQVVVRIAEINSGIGASTVRNDIEVPDDNTARPGDLLFAWSGSLTVARWYRPEAIINQHIFKVVPVEDYPMWFVHQALMTKLADFRATASDKATTMGHIQRHHLDEVVDVPTNEEVGRIGGQMQSCWDLALATEVETLQLARTRDELLPLLMSGKITVKEAEGRASDLL